MQFKFESNQQFQLQAIESVAKLFHGQHFATDGFNLDGKGLAAVPNHALKSAMTQYPRKLAAGAGR